MAACERRCGDRDGRDRGRVQRVAAVGRTAGPRDHDDRTRTQPRVSPSAHDERGASPPVCDRNCVGVDRVRRAPEVSRRIVGEGRVANHGAGEAAGRAVRTRREFRTARVRARAPRRELVPPSGRRVRNRFHTDGPRLLAHDDAPRRRRRRPRPPRRVKTAGYSVVARTSSTISRVVSGWRNARRATGSPCQRDGATNAIWSASSRADQAS